MSIDIRIKVRNCIEVIKEKFENNHNLFLSETDVVCQLYAELLKESDFRRVRRTRSGQSTIALHTEVPFFSRELRGREIPILDRWVDIAILDQSKMTFNRNDFRLSKYSSKIYRFIEEKCCIEVKLNSIDSKRKSLDGIERDLRKLKLLNSEIAFMLALDKRAHLNSNDIESLESKYPDVEVIYGTPSSH